MDRLKEIRRAMEYIKQKHHKREKRKTTIWMVVVVVLIIIGMMMNAYLNQYPGNGKEEIEEMSTPQPVTDVKVKLLGEDGNAFYILGKVSRALRDAGYDKDFIEDYRMQAMSGDYDDLLMVTMTFVHVE